MKKITLFVILALAFSWQGFSQFGCGSGVVITDGYTATGITTPGTGGAEDWNTNPTGTSINASYWDDDVYLFEYTSGVITEEITMEIFSRNSWNGIGIFSDCTGDTFSGELDADSATGSDTSKTVTATIGANTTVYIAVGQWGTPDGVDFDVTEFTVNLISCGSPTNVQVSSLTTNTADFSWDVEAGASDGYNWVVMADGEDPETDTPIMDGSVASGMQMVQVTGLSENTMYDFYVQSNCGTTNGLSGWSDKVDFSTACNTITTLPFTETFGSTSATKDCWTVLDANGDGDAWNLSYGSNAFVDDEVAMMYTDGNSGANDDYLISPSIELTGNERLKFHYRVQSSNEPNDYELLLSTTGTNPTDFTEVLIPSSVVENTSYMERIVDLSSYSGVVNIAWRVPAGGLDGWRLYIDNVIIEELPSCPEVTDVMLDGITMDSADISWTEGDTETEWEVLYGDEGFDPETEGTSVSVTGGTPEVTLTSLTFMNTYDVYVRAICASGDESVWVGPLTFTIDYCESIPTSNDGTGFGEIVLGSETFDNGDDTPYEDYSDTPVDVVADELTTFTVNLNTGFGYDYDYNVWVDLNNNFEFEASELLVSGSTAGAGDEVIDASFTIPAGTLAGNHALRISAADSGQETPNPCYSGSYGNTADFTLNVGGDGGSITDDCGQEQMSNAFENGLFMEEGGQMLANDFIVSANTLNFSVDNITANILTQGGVASMDVIFYEDNAGVPGTMIETFEDLVPTSQDIIGDAFGYDVHEVVLDLPTPVDFAGDGATAVTYWVQLVGEPTAAGTQMGWETTTASIIGNVYAFDNENTTEWTAGDGDGVFSITGQCEYISGCLQPEALTASNITIDSVDLMWTELGDATEWTIEYGAAGFTLGTGTTEVDTDGTPGITINGLDVLTTYDFYVTSNCTGEDSMVSGPLTVTTIDSYCQPEITLTVEPITLVEIANLSNVSDATVDGSPALENFTNLTVEVDQADSYAISLEGNTGGGFENFFTVFVDWNQNGILDDASEVYEIGSIDDSTGTDGQQATGTIEVPADALLGETRMRVFKNYNSSVIDPCSSNGFGQIEDYTVNVSEGVVNPCAAPSDVIVSNITNVSADISWTENGSATEWEIQYDVTGFTPGDGIFVQDNDGDLGETLSGLAPLTTYDVYVRAICADETISDWTAVETFTTDEFSVNNSNFQNFSYYPNPVKSNLSLKAGLEIEKVSIYNLLGQEVISLNPTSLNAEIDLSRLQAGPYMVRVNINGEIKTFKVIKN